MVMYSLSIYIKLIKLDEDEYVIRIYSVLHGFVRIPFMDIHIMYFYNY